MSTSPRSSPLQRPIHWILDWDGTITQKDTLDALVNIAAASKPSFPTKERWKSVVEAYMSDYTSTLNDLTPNELPITLEAEKKLLQALKPAEQRSLDRVFASQIFTDLTSKDIEEGAKKAIESGAVSLRPGFESFFHSISTSNPNPCPNTPSSTFHILSVNWSRHFIHSILSSSLPVPPSSILANELANIPSNLPSSGEISPQGSTKIISSGDKVAHLRSIKEMSGGGTVVYIGDSWPDIECLIEADLGICIRDEEMGSSQRKLAEALERIGIGCERLGDADEKGQRNVKWARDFVEVRRWTEGI